MRAPSKRSTPSKQYSPEVFAVEDNKSREKKKILYTARVKTTPG